MSNLDSGTCFRGNVGVNKTLPGVSAGNCITDSGNVIIA